MQVDLSKEEMEVITRALDEAAPMPIAEKIKAKFKQRQEVEEAAKRGAGEGQRGFDGDYT